MRSSALTKLLGFVVTGIGIYCFYSMIPVPVELAVYVPKESTVFGCLVLIGTLYILFCHWDDFEERIRNALGHLIAGLGLAATVYVLIVAGLTAGNGKKHWGDIFQAVTRFSFSQFDWINLVAFTITCFLVIGALMNFGSALFEKRRRPGAFIHKRGRQLISYNEAKAIAESSGEEGDPGLFWGMLCLPSSVATTHFLVVGATGSGKTVTLRLLMQSVLYRIGKRTDSRALIYDAKQDVLSILAGMGLSCPVITLNPFDKRCAAWDMARDITGPATAQQVASILIPENKHESQPFFGDAARHLLTGVIITFIKTAPESWTFRDVVFAMKNKQRLQDILSILPETKDLLEYFANENTAQNIISTVQSRMQSYEFIAAAWDKASRKVSLKEWLEDEFILVLGNDEATRTALDAINRVIFKRLGELILAQSESSTRRNWIFLDEVREAGELDGLGRLLTKGRSKGACVVLGLQDVEGLRDVYGREVANEIVGLCSNKAILRTDSPSTAEWASSLFGEREVLEIMQSQSQSSGKNYSASSISARSTSAGNSLSEQQQLNKREVVLPSELMDMLPTSPSNGLSGYYLTPSIGAYSARINWNWIQRELLGVDPTVPNIEIRPEGDQYLSPWAEKDFNRLGIALKSSSLIVETEVLNKQEDKNLPKQTDLGFLAGIKRE